MGEQLIGYSLTGCLVVGMMSLLRLYGTTSKQSIDRTDRAAEVRMKDLREEMARETVRHDEERQRWEVERERLVTMISHLHEEGP